LNWTNECQRLVAEKCFKGDSGQSASEWDNTPWEEREEKRTYAAIAEHLGISRERVRQIYNEIKSRLRAHLKVGSDE
jgi:DNA-directed RNA polymerase specialized sigma subunit